jgi:hypothetical protein
MNATINNNVFRKIRYSKFGVVAKAFKIMNELAKSIGNNLQYK